MAIDLKLPREGVSEKGMPDLDYHSIKPELERASKYGVLRISGGRRLEGVLSPQGAKNGALPLIAASVMFDSPIRIDNVLPIRDVRVMLDIYLFLGGRYDVNISGNYITLDPTEISDPRVPWDLAKEIHASFDFLGSLLFRFGEAEVPLPGGCILGTRAVDMHIQGLETLGAEVKLENGVVKASLKGKLRGGLFRFRQRSVGATKNLLMASLRSEERVILDNVAMEPEITQLIEILRRGGASIKRIAPYTLEIEPFEGLLHLPEGVFRNIPDRIEIGTYVLAVLSTGGELEVRDLIPEHLEPFHKVLEEIGVNISLSDGKAIYSLGSKLRGVEVITEPHPGFPTDLQPPLLAFLLTVPDESIIRETVFNNRFGYVPELLRLGADITLLDNFTAVVKGGKPLKGAPMVAPDIRAGASMVIASLYAEGISTIENYLVIDRGYWDLPGKLRSLGAEVELILKGETG